MHEASQESETCFNVDFPVRKKLSMSIQSLKKIFYFPRLLVGEQGRIHCGCRTIPADRNGSEKRSKVNSSSMFWTQFKMALNFGLTSKFLLRTLNNTGCWQVGFI